VSGSGSPTSVAGTRQGITDTYVPVGARTLTIADASGLHAGDDVIVERTPNQDWIDATGMDSCTTVGSSYDTADVTGSTCLDNPWTPAERTMDYQRKITAVNGNTITLDTPMVEAIQSRFGGGAVFKYTFSGRIHQVGVEYLRSESDYASDTDENHATTMVAFFSTENAWARNLTSRFFVQGTFEAGTGSRYVTIQDSASLDHKSQITGGRRYAFNLEHASNVLVMRCYANTARHDFVTGDNTPGPNVFLDSRVSSRTPKWVRTTGGPPERCSTTSCTAASAAPRSSACTTVATTAPDTAGPARTCCSTTASATSTGSTARRTPATGPSAAGRQPSRATATSTRTANR
jgi:hypothetical protein